MVVKVVHCKRVPDCIYIGRPSILGNPFPLEKGKPKGSTLSKYREWFYKQIEEGNPAFLQELNYLIELAKSGDLNLGCWCAPGPCHGDIIKEYIERKLRSDE